MTSPEERAVGWRLARRVAGSDLYAELSDVELAECKELLARSTPPDRVSSERPPAGVACRLACCDYKADCERVNYCQAAILQTEAYRRLLAVDVLPTLRRVIGDAHEEDCSLDRIATELEALRQRINRTL